MTAVEWLEKELIWMDESKNTPYIDLKIKQALEIEKEEMHAEYMRGWKDGLSKQGPPPPPLDRKIWK